MTYKEICDYAEEKEVDIVLLENPKFENSIIGLSSDDRAIYDLELMIKDLMVENKISYEEALEFIEYNTIRALSYFDNAPIILYTK